MLEDFDPNTIADEAVRQIVLYLMNRVEHLEAQVQERDETSQHLHDEINRLNRCQTHRLLRFRGNGAGTGLFWELRQSAV